MNGTLLVTDWLASWPVALCAVALLFGPGLGPAYAAGLRGILAWGTAGLIGCGLTGATAIVCGRLALSWQVGWVAAASAATALAAWGVWRLCGRRSSPTTAPGARRRYLAVAVGVPAVIAVGLQLRRTMMAIGGPERIAQTYDTPYHLNSVRLILDSGNASAMHMTLSNPEASTTFYPGLWHAFVALTVQLTGASIPAAANWVSIVAACVVWPAGMLALGRVLFGMRAAWLGVIVPASFTMTQFPNRLLSFGILYPNLLSYAILPAALALAVFAVLRTHGRGRIPAVGCLGVGAVGLVLAQPNALFALVFVAAPVVVQGLGRATLRLHRRGRAWVLAAVPWLVTGVVVAAGWQAASRIPLVATFTGRVTWPVIASWRRAVKEGLLLTAMHPSTTPNFPEPQNLAAGTPNLVVAALIVAGAVVALFVGRWRWLPFSYAIIFGLWVLVRGLDIPLRGLLTGYWYGDPQRISALLPLIGVPLVAVALGAAITGVTRLMTGPGRRPGPTTTAVAGPGGTLTLASPAASATTRHARPSGNLRQVAGLDRGRGHAGARAVTFTLVLAVTIALSVVLPRTATFRESFSYVAYVYRLDTSSATSTALVDTHEERLMRRMARLVPEGTTVAGNPWDGSVLVWTYADRQDIFPHMAMVMDPERALIATSLRDAKTNPQVCPAVRDLHLGYVLDFGRRFWDAGGVEYPGLVGLDQAGVATLVAHDGAAKLYKITACS